MDPFQEQRRIKKNIFEESPFKILRNRKTFELLEERRNY